MVRTGVLVLALMLSFNVSAETSNIPDASAADTAMPPTANHWFMWETPLDMQEYPHESVILLPAKLNMDWAPMTHEEALTYVTVTVTEVATQSELSGSLSYNPLELVVWRGEAPLSSNTRYSVHYHFDNDTMEVQWGNGITYGSITGSFEITTGATSPTWQPSDIAAALDLNATPSTFAYCCAEGQRCDATGCGPCWDADWTPLVAEVSVDFSSLPPSLRPFLRFTYRLNEVPSEEAYLSPLPKDALTYSEVFSDSTPSEVCLEILIRDLREDTFTRLPSLCQSSEDIEVSLPNREELETQCEPMLVDEAERDDVEAEDVWDGGDTGAPVEEEAIQRSSDCACTTVRSRSQSVPTGLLLGMLPLIGFILRRRGR